MDIMDIQQPDPNTHQVSWIPTTYVHKFSSDIRRDHATGVTGQMRMTDKCFIVVASRLQKQKGSMFVIFIWYN